MKPLIIVSIVQIYNESILGQVSTSHEIINSVHNNRTRKMLIKTPNFLLIINMFQSFGNDELQIISFLVSCGFLLEIITK